jgi:hypothetical protein
LLERRLPDDTTHQITTFPCACVISGPTPQVSTCPNAQQGDPNIEARVQVCEQRYNIVHRAKPLTSDEIKAVWSGGGVFVVLETENATNDILQLMNQVMKEVCAPNWTIPEKVLLRSLYRWGLNLLQSEIAS